MSRRWEENRTDGRLCLVIDAEDGTHPQRVYGKDKDEILEKVSRTVEHASRHIAALKAQPTASPRTNGTQPVTTAPRKPMTPDQQMQATSDLSNPAKAPQAVRSLLDEATNGEFEQFQLERKRRAATESFANIAAAWALKHPEFPSHPANKRMLADSSALRAGGLGNVTEDILQTVYLELLESGMLVEDNPSVQPGENPAPRTVREREATSYRKNGLRATTPATTSTQPKYTRAQVDALSADKMLEKYNTDPEFRRAVDLYAQPRLATA
jgi:hypothetical protein